MDCDCEDNEQIIPPYWAFAMLLVADKEKRDPSDKKEEEDE